MSMKRKIASESIISAQDLSVFLRGLADAVDAGELVGEAGPESLEGFTGFKVGAKALAGGGMRVKVRVKFPRPAGVPAAPDEEGDEEEGSLPKYSSLKKHMKYTFKAIGQALAAGQLPPREEADSFVADSRLMVSYPGKGDPFYAEYLEKTEAFAAALDAGDLDALRALHAELARLKRECHSRHA